MQMVLTLMQLLSPIQRSWDILVGRNYICIRCTQKKCNFLNLIYHLLSNYIVLFYVYSCEIKIVYMTKYLKVI